MTAYPARARPASPTAALFGAVMALVALTVGFATLGVYLGRDSGGAAWFVAWLLSLGCLIGLNVASSTWPERPRGGAAAGLRSPDRLGRLDDDQLLRRDGPARAPSSVRCDRADASRRSARGGFAVRRDLSFLYRILFWLLLALLAAAWC